MMVSQFEVGKAYQIGNTRNTIRVNSRIGNVVIISSALLSKKRAFDVLNWDGEEVCKISDHLTAWSSRVRGATK